MKASEKQGHSLSHCLANFLLTYRSTPHSTTGVTPCKLFLQRDIRTRFDLLRPDYERKVCEKRAKQVAHHNQHAKMRQFHVGQKVMVKDMRPTDTKWIPGVDIKQLGPVSYLVKVEQGLHWKRHIDHLRAHSETSPRTESPTHPQSASMAEAQDSDVFMPVQPDQEQTPNVEPSSSDEHSHSRYPSRNQRPPERLMWPILIFKYLTFIFSEGGM